MSVWLRQHRSALVDTWQRLLRQPTGFILNVLVLASAFVLPVAGFTVIENLRPLTHKITTEPEISLFMRNDASRAQVQQTESQLRSLSELTQVTYVPREKALAQLKAQSDMADVLNALPSNPLPDAFIVQPRQHAAGENSARLEELAQTLRGWPGVEHVQLDSAWVKRMDALLHLARLALVGLASILALAAIAVVFNTIRLQVLLARDEIEVMRLIGATDSFIRRPFFYLGTAQGILAGASAWGLTAAALGPLNQALATLVQLYAAEFQFAPLGGVATLALLACCGGLGWIGAGLSVGKYLSTR
ncbi:ABC transporter permease [Parvibium lacunae]|uniref:Cell division protein FtsX n=1 Tax=Parvibium lacunae TaxID=1888893 RepID=A0A368L153_9BURK|nr:ABC transporter permease [Parvibium lacunae]